MRKLTLNPEGNLFILSHYSPITKKPLQTPWGPAQEIYVNKILKPSKVSEFGSESYRASLSRAFNRAKQQIYFNPDMTKFVTLTYAENMQDIDKLLSDVKYLIKQQQRNHNKIDPKYLFIIEQQDRGAYHVHMICNDFLDTYTNKNGYQSIKYWKHGYTSLLDITGADNNFKPYLYLFKYMKKSQRVGKSFVHASKNLNNFTPLNDFDFDEKLHTLKFKEIKQMGYLDRTIEKKYYEK